MEPLNINTKGCTEQSSNCVVYQGPTIECIGLCQGATVTQVVYELATKLCGVLEKLDVSRYDLTCLNTTTCPPETFEEMLQLLVERVCEIAATPCPPCEDGTNGNYIVTEYEPSGPNCQYGGVVIYTYDGITGLPIGAETRYVCNGQPGTDGDPGTPGGPGTPGKKGEDGSNGNDATPASVTFDQTADCEIEVEQTQAFPDYIFKLSLQDSGWKDLRGFDHYGVGLEKPQVRKIGKALHFRGRVTIPLASDSGATLINLTNFSSYVNQPYNQVYTGVGGANVITDGTIFLNKSGSVLPLDLDLCGKTIDGTYEKQYISTRQINTSGNSEGVSLASVFHIFINASGQLIVQTLKDLEDNSVATSGGQLGGSPLRYITSKVRSGEYVPDFSAAASTLHSNPATGTQNIEGSFSARTYLFDCDAAEPAQIGGFTFRLDGLTVFLT